jgi:transcriptional regulator of acetoin/glycerol metabolism
MMAYRATSSAAHARLVATSLDGGRQAALPPRALIIDSWKRCASQYRLDPSQSDRTRILTSSELKDYQEPMSPLMRIARPILEDLYRHLEPIGYCVLFTDLNGVAFDFLNHPSLDDEHRSAGLYLGSVWTEETEGTNGVGTCIVTGRPLTVHRSDHFRSKNAELSCTVAPVFDPDGRFAAVLDVSTARPDKGGAARYAEHLVDITTRRLANAWFRERHRDRWVLRLFPDCENLDPAREGLVALDGDGAVVAISDAARNMLAAERSPPPAARRPAGGRPAASDTASPPRGAEEALAAWLGQQIGVLSDGPLYLSPPRGGDRPLYLIPVPPARGGRRAYAPPGGQGRALIQRERPMPTVRAEREAGRGEAPETMPLEAFAGGDLRVHEAVRLARRARDNAVPLLVTGETGTGKTTFARALHADAGGGRLVELSLGGRDGAAVETLVAKAMEEAATLVLDDVGEMADDAQHAALRQLKRLEAEAVRRPTLVSTSQQPLPALQATMRADLFYRLAGAHVVLPPLRVRSDREALIAAVVEELAAADPERATAARMPGFVRTLAAASWPGNLRELRSVVRLVLAAGDDGAAGAVEALGRERRRAGGLAPPERNDGAADVAGAVGSGPIVEQAVDDLERLLAANQWCVSKVARLLAVDRSTVHRRMNRFGLVPPQRRT